MKKDRGPPERFIDQFLEIQRDCLERQYAAVQRVTNRNPIEQINELLAIADDRDRLLDDARD